MGSTKNIPVLLYEGTSGQDELRNYRELKEKLNPVGQKEIESAIKNVEHGLEGENNVQMELLYCYVTPMLILHDVYYEVEGRTAQIDFLVFTKKFCIVIESKYWSKNIELNNNDEFVVVDGNKRSGMYSPITQNKRHMEVIKQLEIERTGEITPSFKEIYKSLIVFSNDEIIINKEAATNEVKNQVIRRDQLVEYIENEYKASENPELSDVQLQEWAKWFLDRRNGEKKDYTLKYNKYRKDEELGFNEQDRQLEKRLKDYRSKKKTEGVFAYEVFLDKQCEIFVKSRPKDTVELLRAYAKGVGEIDFISDESKIRSWLKNIGEAVDKYGDEILAIIGEEGYDI